MSHNLLAIQRPLRVDYFLITLIAVYIGYYSWAGKMIISGTTDETSTWLTAMLLVVPMVALASVLSMQIVGWWTFGSLGLELGRRAYGNFVLSLIVVIAVVISPSPAQASTHTLLDLLLIAINLMAAEVVLRATVMELVLKLLGKTVVGINIAVVLSVLLYALVQTPAGVSSSLLPIAWGIAGSLIYYGTRSVLALVLLNSLILLPGLDTASRVSLAALAVALYVSLALLKNRLGRSTGRERG